MSKHAKKTPSTPAAETVEVLDPILSTLDGWAAISLARVLHKVRCTRGHGKDACLFYADGDSGLAHRKLWVSYAEHALKKGCDAISMLEGIAFREGWFEYEGKEILYTQTEIEEYEASHIKKIKTVVSGNFKKTEEITPPPKKGKIERPFTKKFEVELEVEIEAAWDPSVQDANENVFCALDSFAVFEADSEESESTIHGFTIKTIDGQVPPPPDEDPDQPPVH